MPRALLLLGGVASLLAACSSDYPIRVVIETTFVGAVRPTDVLCNVSGTTTTATGHSAGPATVVLELTVQDGARHTVGTSPSSSRMVPSGHAWNWTLRARNGTSVPKQCTVDTVGSIGPAATP